MVICLLLLSISILPVKLEAESLEHDEFDSFVHNQINTFIIGTNINSEDVRIGEGIFVYNLPDADAKFYPVYLNNKLSYVFEVYKRNGILGGAFSANLVSSFEKLFSFGEFVDCRILAVSGHLYGISKNKIIDFRTNEIVKSFNDSDYKNTLPRLILSDQPFYVSFRSSTPSWTTYFCSSGLGYGCVPQTLYNIFKNYGKSFSSWTTVKIEMNGANGTSGLNDFTHSQIQTYLSYKNANISYQSTSGKLSYNTCDSLLSNGEFIMAISKTTYYDNSGQLQTGYHATAVIGTPTSTTIRMCDPHGSSSGGIINISYSTASFTSSGLYYTWNSGYYAGMTY